MDPSAGSAGVREPASQPPVDGPSSVLSVDWTPTVHWFHDGQMDDRLLSESGTQQQMTCVIRRPDGSILMAGGVIDFRSSFFIPNPDLSALHLLLDPLTGQPVVPPIDIHGDRQLEERVLLRRCAGRVGVLRRGAGLVSTRSADAGHFFYVFAMDDRTVALTGTHADGQDVPTDVVWVTLSPR